MKNKICLNFITIVFCLLAVTWGNTLVAQGNISIAEEDKELKVRGFWNENENSLYGYVQMTLQGGGSGELRMLTYDLINDENPNRMIDRGSVYIEPITLALNEPTNVKVFIENVPAEGTYTGKIKFYLAGTQNYAEVPVEVTATLSEPNRAKIMDSVVTAQVVAGTGFNFLLPVKLRAKEFVITVENSGNTELTLEDYSFYARNQNQNGSELDKTHFKLVGDLPMTIGPDTRETLHFKLIKKKGVIFNRYKKLDPGSYKGNLQLEFDKKSEAEPVVVDLNIDSRAGVGWVLLALFFGIILGKIIKDMSSPTAELQVALMAELTDLKERLNELKDINDGNDFALGKDYQKVLDKVNKASESNEEVVRNAITAFAGQLDHYFGLADTIEKIRANSSYSEAEKVSHIRAVRDIGNNISMGVLKVEDISSVLGMLQKAWQVTVSLQKIKRETDGDEILLEEIENFETDVKVTELKILEGATSEAIEKRLEGIKEAIRVNILGEAPNTGSRDVNAKPKKKPKPKPKPVVEEVKPTFMQNLLDRIGKAFGQPLKYFLFILMDYKEPNASVRFWFFKPLLTLIILVAAIMAGLQDAYIENGATFGISGFSDYLNLIFYGAGSKIAASTIGDLGDKGAQHLSSKTGGNSTSAGGTGGGSSTPANVPSSYDDVSYDDEPEELSPEDLGPESNEEYP